MHAHAEYLVSPLLQAAGFRHAFFTRRGGVSEAPFASLNFSATVGDAPARVSENLRRAAHVLQVAESKLCFASQVHGSAHVWVDARSTRDQVLAEEADAVLSTTSDLACGVRTADCVPILLADRRSGAAAAVHAGWRGVVGSVVEAALRELQARLSEPPDWVAAIGPHISSAAFEVSEDVAEQLRASSPDPSVVDWSHARPHVDLRRIVRAKLQQLGVAYNSIDDVLGCTVSDPEQFFSYRRDGSRSGRHLSAIVPQTKS